MKINLRESLNKIDLATDNKYDLLNTFDSKKLSDNSKKKLAEAIENNSIASINRVLHESKEQLYKVVIQSGATKRDFESALYEDEAEGIIDYYGGRWIDENGFEWDMYIEEDDDSSEHAMIDNSHDMENIDESLKESIDISDYEKLHYPLRDGDKYYQLYRKIEDGRGVWAAAELDKYGSDVIGEPFKITYEQARGFEPIEDSSIRKLSRDLGKKLLPKRENLKEQINLPGYAVKYTTGYSGNGVNSGKTEWFRTREERDRRAKELKDKNYTEIKTWKMDNFYHALPKNESLNEDFDDEYESDFDDNEVEEGNHVFADGEEYVWVERIAGPIYLDFDKWAVWSARVFVDPRDFMTIHSDGKNYDFDGDAFKKKAMAAPIVYFVVEEDTGFIDWGPVESRIEAQDFLNGKQEDWDNDEYYGESLEKNLDEWYVHTIHYEDIGDGRAYDYEVDHEEVLDYLSEIAIDEEDAPEDTEEYLKWVEDNFDELFNKYEYEIEEHFREDASQEEYDRRHSSYEQEYDTMD